ncbi:hypothetical protein C0V75_00345 [Tabrizicola sp. TH137]|uniref:hypothetical protein n=1 Tax=Tabrizicola sp. TH137 TaxID=2067452 RepID=UPI000C7B8E72|nr:hypothetical protein [Tabrizicola sp. TH137]PLL13945.1 hypothetical protein C0V75_00345 [Tabrizicola sp. TH137]
MSRDLPPDFAAALAERDLRPVIFFEGAFASGPVRLWSGLGEIDWAGESWSGAGALLGLGSIEETSEVVAGGTSVSLSGIPPSLVQMAIAEARQGLPGRVWLGLLTPEGAIIADPVLAFAGRLDVPEITDDAETCRITISYESRLIDLNTPRSWRYTHESQQALHPGDLGFEYVSAIQDREVTWGRG